jgi:endoglucanase Acf2
MSLSSKFPFLHRHDQQPPHPQQAVQYANIPQGEHPHSSGDNIFRPFSNDAPPIASRADHPVPTSFIRHRNTPVSDTRLAPLSKSIDYPLETNRFYSNFFLGSQSCPSWSQPYSVWWSKGRGNCGSWGMSVTHIERDALAYGPQNNCNACNFFFGPIGNVAMQKNKCQHANYLRDPAYVSVCH